MIIIARNQRLTLQLLTRLPRPVFIAFLMGFDVLLVGFTLCILPMIVGYFTVDIAFNESRGNIDIEKVWVALWIVGMAIQVFAAFTIVCSVQVIREIMKGKRMIKRQRIQLWLLARLPRPAAIFALLIVDGILFGIALIALPLALGLILSSLFFTFTFQQVVIAQITSVGAGISLSIVGWVGIIVIAFVVWSIKSLYEQYNKKLPQREKKT